MSEQPKTPTPTVVVGLNWKSGARLEWALPVGEAETLVNEIEAVLLEEKPWARLRHCLFRPRDILYVSLTRNQAEEKA